MNSYQPAYCKVCKQTLPCIHVPLNPLRIIDRMERKTVRGKDVMRRTLHIR